MATYIIGVKVIKDKDGNPIEFNKQYYTFMSRYNSFIYNSKIALEFKSVEEAMSWWEGYKRNYPERIIQTAKFADLSTLSVRRVMITYKLAEKLTI